MSTLPCPSPSSPPDKPAGITDGCTLSDELRGPVNAMTAPIADYLHMCRRVHERVMPPVPASRRTEPPAR